VADQFSPAAPGTVRGEGWLGQRMASNLAHHVVAQTVGRSNQPFRDRTEENSGHWRCEYWGKWFTSAALGCAYEPTPEPRAVLDRGVKERIATQAPDGYIGTYQADKHLGI
jgi:hypothetical protein